MTVAGFVGLIVKNLDEVPYTGRKRFICMDENIMTAIEAEGNVAVARALLTLQASQRVPGLLWPDDHPTTITCRRIWSDLIAHSGIEAMDWQVEIVNFPGELSVVRRLSFDETEQRSRSFHIRRCVSGGQSRKGGHI